MVSLYSAARVNPKVLQAILGSLLTTEDEFVIAFLLFACFAREVLVGHFFIAGTPCMRENSIRRSVAAYKIDKNKASGTLELQKTH